MPPPMIRRSTLPRRLAMTPSLSETFAPPSTTAYGRRGSSVSCFSTSTSAATSPPAACGSRLGTSYTLACLRCTAPKPSPTYSSARAASASANAPRSASSLLVSPALKRRFSSRATSPSASAPTVGLRRRRRRCRSAKRTSAAEQLAQARGHRLQGVLRVRLALGTPEVGAHDDACALPGELGDRGHAGADAAVVADDAVLDAGRSGPSGPAPACRVRLPDHRSCASRVSLKAANPPA